MNSFEWCKERLDLKITDWPGDGDLFVTTNSTADGYDLYVVSHDLRRIEWENEVFYYADDEYVRAIIDSILDHGEGMIIYDGTYELEDNEYLWDELQIAIQEGDE